MSVTFSIASRFNGPPNCGNGGYAAGLIAEAIAQPITVRLAKPLPLETPLSVSACGEHWEVHAGDLLIASARPAAAMHLEAPEPPPFREALALAAEAATHGNARFWGCFVCGAQRVLPDGLRIFSGNVAPGVVAAPFRPDPSLAGVDGQLRHEFVWAALDCPGYFACFQDTRYALLGELTVQIERPVHVAEPHVIVGWAIERQGRKRLAGTALFDAEGSCCAHARAAWIEIAAPT